MKDRKLLVKQLSATGELIRVITCFGGQISVFRATSPAALRPFQRAFIGLPGPEKIVISLDDAQFVPNQHILIGFGERWSDADSATTIAEFIARSGAAPAIVDSLLLAAGLDRVANKTCGTLSTSEERRLRLIAGLQDIQKILVLDDPFDPLEPQWRERFAEMMTQHVRSTPRIIVVTSLNQRPESWIDNERVTRIQVGETVQRTIGFGSQNSELKDLLHKVRTEGRAEVEPPHETPQRLGQSAAYQQKQEPPVVQERATPGHYKGFLALLAVLIVVGIAFGASLGLRENQEDSTDTADENRSSSEILALSASSSSLSNQESSQASVTTSAAEPTSVPEPISLVLNLYPEDIRSSIVQSFEGISRDDSAQMAARGRSPRLSIEAERGGAAIPSSPPSSSNELLRVLQSTSSTSEGPSSESAPPAPEDLSNLPPEQRREIIRQRFLEAIQKAAQEQPQ